MSEEEFYKEMSDVIPITSLTKEQFEYIKTLTRIEAQKYIRANTSLSLKESAIYYDLYKDKNYDTN